MLATVVILSTASGSGTTTQTDANCTPTSLGYAFSKTLELRSIDSFGCAGSYSYVWATVGTGPAEISVTEILHFDDRTQRWVFLSRLDYCTAGRLPQMVYLKGCFSN